MTSAEFITRWQASSAAERANYQLFLSELCDILCVPRPDPTVADESQNIYVFEKNATFHNPDGTTSNGRIDLYKRAHFALEAKQGSNPLTPSPSQGEGRGEGLDLPFSTPAPPILKPPKSKTRRGTAPRHTPAWSDAMLRARGQAESYVRALPDDNPPFILVVDVGHSIELYSDFSRLGKTYTPFPDATAHRIFLKDFTNPALLDRLKQVWLDPLSLDPSRKSAKVTRDIAANLAELAKSLERSGHHPELVAHFLMRCLFTLFAEDVKLIKDDAFTNLLKSLQGQARNFVHLVVRAAQPTVRTTTLICPHDACLLDSASTGWDRARTISIKPMNQHHCPTRRPRVRRWRLRADCPVFKRFPQKSSTSTKFTNGGTRAQC